MSDELTAGACTPEEAEAIARSVVTGAPAEIRVIWDTATGEGMLDDWT